MIEKFSIAIFLVTIALRISIITILDGITITDMVQLSCVNRFFMLLKLETEVLCSLASSHQWKSCTIHRSFRAMYLLGLLISIKILLDFVQQLYFYGKF